MKPEQWLEIERIYHAALEQKPGERAAFVVQECGSDEELRREIESLLAEEAGAGAFIERSAMEVAAREIASAIRRLPAGRRLGAYQIVEPVGAGGMGEVYRARDIRLDRTVAIKVPPSDVPTDDDRVRRFLREAKAASALSHPNVAHIYEIGESDGTSFIAMEFVEGRTLAAAIAERPLEERHIVDIAVQIADALDEAHMKGITHRDIKPANIMLTARGQVKVLDFGVAKLNPLVGESATRGLFAATATAAGVVMGTVDYMSPEQALGREVDGRSDLFSLGVVLYEMATGRSPFRGATATETMDRIRHHDPGPLMQFSTGTSPALERIVRKCLEKDRQQRYQSAHDLLTELRDLQREHISGSASAATSGGFKRWQSGVLATLVILAAGALAWSVMRREAPAGGAPPSRLSMLVSAASDLSSPDLSPDGRTIVYGADEAGRVDLFVSRVAGGARVRLTNDAARESGAHFSPDGERIIFTRIEEGSEAPDVYSVPSLGGDAAPLLHHAFDATWSPDGTRLAFIQWTAGGGHTLATCKADGSDLRPLMRADAMYPFLRDPVWSPDGSTLACVRSSGGTAGETWLIPATGQPARKFTSDRAGVFSHHPVFTADGRAIIDSSNRGGATNIWMLPLDGSASTRLTTGTGPDRSPAVARTGSVVFENTRSRCALLVENLKSGQTRELLTDPFIIWAPVFSADARELAFTRFEADGSWHIWTASVEDGRARQLTSSAVPEIYPRYAGEQIVYHTWGPGPSRLWRVPRSGGPVAPLFASQADDSYADVSPDGRSVAFVRTDKGSTRIWIAGLDGSNPRRLLDISSTLPRWSPDGKWIAFSPSRSYNAGVFVAAADGTGLRKLTSTGSWPVWWPDGKRIGYVAVGRDGNQAIYTVPLTGGEPHEVTRIQFRGNNYPFDVSRDGSLLATSNQVLLSSEIWMLEPGSRP